MNRSDWKIIVASLKQGSCVALIGPGLATAAVDGQPRNLLTMLSRRLADELQGGDADNDVEIPDPDDFPLVAQCYVEKFSPDVLQDEVKSFYTEVSGKVDQADGHDQVFENLASLPITLFVTTRHDGILEHYLTACGKNPIVRAYDFNGDQQRTVGELGSVGAPLVYGLLGSTDDPRSLALTEDDLLNLLERLIAGNPGLPHDLRTAFHEKSFLFLGCGLRSYYMRVLLHALGLSRSEKPSYAADAMHGDEQDPEFAKSVWFYRVGYKRLKLLDLDETGFLEELRKQWEENKPDDSSSDLVTTVTGIEPPSDAPEVFISYMSEDAEYAKQVGSALERKGIRVWIDKDSLRGGARWDMSLEDAIASVDFFILLMSSHLTDATETYVHKEIKMALERKSRKSATIKFIFPMRIDKDAPMLDSIERAKIQVASLMDLDTDIAGLATDIKRQYAKLSRR